MPLSRENYDTIVEALYKTAVINTDKLKKYLLKKTVSRINIPITVPVQDDKQKVAMTLPPVLVPLPQPMVAYRLSFENIKTLEQTIKHLKFRAYSNSTIPTYRGELMMFFRPGEKFQPLVLQLNM